MQRVSSMLIAGVMAAGMLAQAQGGDADKILAAARQALGGEAKLAAVKSLTATGHNSRGDIEIAIELPDKFLKKEVFAQVMDISLARTSGFNGAGLIEEIETPPAMPGLMIRTAGGASPDAAPAQREAARANMTLAAKREFARLALGMFASSFNGYPLHLTYAGQAESPDGKADVIDVKSDDGFAGRLFVSTQTHLPLMVTWMDKEPAVVTMGGPVQGGRAGSTPAPGSGGMVVMGGPGGGTFTQGAPAGRGQMSPEERDKMMQDGQARAREAEANRRTVEFRMYYSDYKDVDGIKSPFTISRSVDGQPQDALTLEKVKVNPKIDAKKFEISKSSS
jgi:hypothetical protein